ncbi:hypothetical protein ILYODFUR_013615 [Ilyodon furcidens]|uniref:Uncharacterized protein n=1 Tax=Ilyodon furcidens TaxID=33524 RepID=A0ABV0SXS1_9TELE
MLMPPTGQYCTLGNEGLVKRKSYDNFSRPIIGKRGKKTHMQFYMALWLYTGIKSCRRLVVIVWKQTPKKQQKLVDQYLKDCRKQSLCHFTFNKKKSAFVNNRHL